MMVVREIDTMQLNTHRLNWYVFIAPQEWHSTVDGNARQRIMKWQPGSSFVLKDKNTPAAPGITYEVHTVEKVQLDKLCPILSRSVYGMNTLALKKRLETTHKGAPLVWVVARRLSV
jgi:hypothetical protein